MKYGSKLKDQNKNKAQLIIVYSISTVLFFFQLVVAEFWVATDTAAAGSRPRYDYQYWLGTKQS